MLLKRKISSAITLLRRKPKMFVQALTGSVYCYRVYSADVDSIQQINEDQRFWFRKLDDHDLEALAMTDDAAYQLHHLSEVGRNLAYGAFCGPELAHVAWLIPWQYHPNLPRGVLRLREGEAEITTCYTVPAFRGQGIYPRAIRHLCSVASSLDIHRVYMITKLDNDVSSRGIVKAGLVKRGVAVQYFLPMVPSGKGVVLPLYS